MYINTPKDLGKLIAKGRKDKGWNQSQLAQHIGIHQPEISKLENDLKKVSVKPKSHLRTQKPFEGSKHKYFGSRSRSDNL